MQGHNFDEYSLIRSELESLKSCITTYAGFVLGGAGVAVLLIGRAVIEVGSGEDLHPFGYAALALSLVVTSVFSILLYKFNSHNRYAGYCKLLTQECIELREGSQGPSQVVGWEICIDQLRKSDLDDADLVKDISDLKITGVPLKRIQEEVRRRSGGKCEVDKGSAGQGLHVFFRILIGQGVKSDSWHFPAYVASAFLMLTVMFLVAAYVLLGPETRRLQASFENLAWGGIFAYQVFIWAMYSLKLGRLMNGSATVDSYCWAFVLVRIALLKSHLGTALTGYTLTAV